MYDTLKLIHSLFNDIVLYWLGFTYQREPMQGKIIPIIEAVDTSFHLFKVLVKSKFLFKDCNAIS